MKEFPQSRAIRWPDLFRARTRGILSCICGQGACNSRAFVIDLKRFYSSNKLRVWAMCLTVVLFLGLIGNFYIPGKGFTALIIFGDVYTDRFLPEVKALDYYRQSRSPGYDSQWYVQLAVRPDIRRPEMRDAVDNLPYRARRMLFCWTAHVLGFGKPEWIVQVYALQNVACWLALAVVLLRWFPPIDWENYARWVAVLFSCGLITSVSAALVDGPSLLMIASAVALFEANRPWLAAALMGVAGLGKETNLFGAGVVARPVEPGLLGWGKVALRGLCVVAPALCWFAFLVSALGPVGPEAAHRAFAAPFAEYIDKWAVVIANLGDSTMRSGSLSSLFVLVALSTQFALIAFRPRWREAWWRVGAGFALLMPFLGEAVWEGEPGASGRVLLPMVLAFNVLLPKGARWWWLLVLGNLSLLNAPSLLKPPGGDGVTIAGPSHVRTVPVSHQPVTVKFEGPWLDAQRTFWDYWRWAEASANVRIENPHASPIVARIEFVLESRTPRELSVSIGDRVAWKQEIGRQRVKVDLKDIGLNPGVNLLKFETEGTATVADPLAPKLTFRVYDLKVTVAEKK